MVLEKGGEENCVNDESLENAFKALRHNSELTAEEESSLIKFADKFTTCTLNHEKAAEHLDDEEEVEKQGKQIIKIVKECQVHHHTKTCKKKGGQQCRFNFPKYPIWKTVLSHGVEGETLEDREERSLKHQKILRLVREVLDNQNIMDKILRDYKMEEETKMEYEINRKKRILHILSEAQVTPEEYMSAIKESSKRGVTVVLARDITETMVNNYNGEWIRAWNANLDLQVCLDFFSVITYIMEYFTKVTYYYIFN